MKSDDKTIIPSKYEYKLSIKNLVVLKRKTLIIFIFWRETWTYFVVFFIFSSSKNLKIVVIIIGTGDITSFIRKEK